ncbi:hypothetical protein N7495_004086 [Penicillium taxi]|uniref:uncharacterized protein n=1 Tax=Penicillium taxi TaxID=168475 RepID=UPI0025459FF5|nr:uncharacterized protein N7495_004086 [Penicillium taxi]KAJ5899342.1 hypothetical protein N7495_004086 [Penicillium taxi]
MDTNKNKLLELLDAKQQLSEVADTFASCHLQVVMLLGGDVNMTIEMANNVPSYSVKVTSTVTAIDKVCPTYGRGKLLDVDSAVRLENDLHRYYALVIQLFSHAIKLSKQPRIRQRLSCINPFESSLKSLLDQESHAATGIEKQIPRAFNQINQNLKNLIQDEIRDNAEILRKFTNHGTYIAKLITRPASQSSSLMYYALLHASRRGCNDLVASLLQVGANVNWTVLGRVPLIASDEDHQWLETHSQSVIVDGIKLTVGKPGRTALQAATEEGHLEVVERLLAVNANVNARRYIHYRSGDLYHEQTVL